ncbi:MAG: hypothetical protein ABI647_21235 [Gemmatimonadota bacterium]
MSAAAAPVDLRLLLAERFPDAVVLPERRAAPQPTGVARLDQILPNGGLPRGRLTIWNAAQGSGAVAVLRAACFGALARGERAAWIDGQGTTGPHWKTGPLLIRPSSLLGALRAAEIVLKSGGFALVVLVGVDPEQTAMLRLSRMVQEGGGAFVALTHRTLTASLRLTSRFLITEYRKSTSPFGDTARIDAVTVRIEAYASGWRADTTLDLPALTHDLRLSLDPGLADRRGALD